MAAAPAASCMNTEHGCVMFDCLVHLWEWLDPPVAQSQFEMENKKSVPATQQPHTQHLMAHHVHPDQIYQQHPQMATHLTSTQAGQLQPNGVMHQLLQSQYHSNMNARSPLLENRHDLYGTGQNHDYARHYGANDNYNYPQSPPRGERTEIHTDHNVNHELLQNMPKGYNAEVYQDYLKRNPPKDANQIYQNHQPMYRPNVNQYGSKPYLPYSSRIGPQSNTELLRRQYNEIQQMKLQQQMHYQNQAQMHQQQKFAERQLLLQQIHGVQPPANLQNSIYSDSSYRDFDRYSGKNDFSPETPKEMYAKSNEFREMEKQNRHYQEQQWQSNQVPDMREQEQYSRRQMPENDQIQSPQSDYNNQSQKSNVGVVSPMKSSESSSPSVKSPSSDSRRSSSGTQALRSPVAQRIPSAPVTMSGILYKQGSDGLKVWRKRWFVLSEYCLFYYKSQDEEKLLGSVLLPSYKVSACTQEDKVLRKFSFKLEHANMRTYILAAPDQESMMKWVKALTMAALMQSPNEQPQSQNERTAVKTEDGDDIPTYANAPPKPRRSNEGYNSPSPDMYDPNYDLLKKPASQYSQSTSHNRYPDHGNYSSNPNQEYTRSPQSPPQQTQYKRPYDTQHLSLPLTNVANENQQNKPAVYTNNSQSPYFDRNHHQVQENQQEQLYERQAQRNPFLQESPQVDMGPTEEMLNTNQERKVPNMDYNETRNMNDLNAYNRDVYGELNARPSRVNNAVNDRLANDRRTPDAYGRSTTMSPYKGKIGDYEDVYGTYASEKDFVPTHAKTPSQQARDAISISSHQQARDANSVSSHQQSRDAISVSSHQQSRDAISVSSHQQQQEPSANYQPPEKTFSGPSVLRRKKMQSSGIQPPMPRPHSADFLEYESKNENLNRSAPTRNVYEPTRQPQRPKSSLDINSYYDPSSDRYYSEESYAEKMRQSAHYLQQQGNLGARIPMDIPLAKYASGLAQKQLSTAYTQLANNNYETEFTSKNRDNVSYSSKYGDIEGLNSNWTLKEKGIENQKDYINRSGSVMSEGSNISGYVKDGHRFDPNSDGFIRSASARLPSSANEKDGEKKVQQREESMKRLLEWKQRMLQSPLTRKSTPATISLARSLNHSRQSLRSDQYKSKTYANASYNSYSSDDEEETTVTDLQKPREMQAGRSQYVNLTSIITMRPITPHVPCVDQVDHLKEDNITPNVKNSPENTYENILCTISIPKINLDEDYDLNVYEEAKEIQVSQNCDENKQREVEEGYETHESEAESETQIEYTDNDLDEVLLDSEAELKNSEANTEIQPEDKNEEIDEPQTYVDGESATPGTPTAAAQGEDHYLPMSPRKASLIEQAHKDIIKNLQVFDKTIQQTYEDNPYVEMNVGNEDDNAQTYEVVCINNSKPEPVYMELNNVSLKEATSNDLKLSDTASNFADTKDHTLKRVSKNDNKAKDKTESSDVVEDTMKENPLDSPFSRFSISDTFRPASYYLNGSKNTLEMLDSSDSDILSPPPIPSSSPPCEELTDEALSKYILEKLDKSDMSTDNSILKLLTAENQNMNTVKRKTTSLMIYGSRTSIHDTLSRGEKIRNNRASLNERNKMLETSPILSNSNLEQYNSSSVESDSVRSYNADRGSSRLSLESDISSKFDMTPSNMSSEVTSLNESEIAIDFRHSNSYNRDLEMMKRRPLSDDSIFELAESEFPLPIDTSTNVDLDRYLDNLQPGTSDFTVMNGRQNSRFNVSAADISNMKENVGITTLHPHTHVRCSSTPISHNNNRMNTLGSRQNAGMQFKNISEQTSGYTGSQSSCSSVGLPRSPISYYCKNYNEEVMIRKNLNNEIMTDKIKEFDNEKLALKSSQETNASSTSTGFHSRESSTEHSAPYYYSDLSSQEHINLLPPSHYLKNTNLYRKLNNQRRRGPLHKKNEISHIHNPIRNNQLMTSEQSFELAAARSVSVEFLTATDKDPEIDLKNIYESTGGRNSKIPESMNLSGLGCKRNSSSNNSNCENSSIECTANASALIKLSSTSMSSHCSGNSSNTVYYDAEAEASAYENIICNDETLWTDNIMWRNNLTHRHAKSMDDLDSVTPKDTLTPRRVSFETCGMNSIKRVKKDCPKKLSRNVTYVNCDFQGRVLMCRENLYNSQNVHTEEESKSDDNDVYVSLAENAETSLSICDEGVYEQLAVESPGNSMISVQKSSVGNNSKKNKFEIDREKLRQWDLMSSGLMKSGVGRVRGVGAGVGSGDAACSTDTGTHCASNEASMTITGNNMETGANNNSNNQQALSKKSFLGSNTSIGRSSRDGTIPVRAVSPRVRWVEDKPSNDHYGSQQMSTSQQNLNILSATEDSWANMRSPSRASQQPIRAVSPRVRRNTENGDVQKVPPSQTELSDIPTAGELLGRTHEELVLLLIQLRRRHAATHRAIEQCCSQINSIEDSLSSLKTMEREENLQRLEHLKMQLMELEQQYEKSKPLVQLVDNMVKLGSLYNRPGSTMERLERNQRLRQKVLAEHALEQQRWLESVAAGKPLETEAARSRVAELWALEQELADEAAILQGMKSDKDTIESLLTGVRGKLATVHKSDLLASEPRRHQPSSVGLEAELARVHAMLTHNSKKLEQTVADNARLERELQQLRRALQARRAAAPAHPTAMLEDEVSRVQQLVSALQRQRQELSRAVRHLTQQSHALQNTHDSMPGKRRPLSAWSETNLDTGHTIDHGYSDYDYDTQRSLIPPGHYDPGSVDMPLYVDTRAPGDVTSPLTSEDIQHGGFGNLSNVEKQEIKTVRIVKRESERRQRDRERSLQPLADWPSNMSTNLEQFIEEELVQSLNNTRASSLPRTDYYKTPPNYLAVSEKNNMDLSPKYVSSPSLSNYDYSHNMSSLNSSYNRSYGSGYDKMSLSTQYLNSPTESSRTLTNDPLSKTSSIASLNRSNMELSPIFKSEAAKQIITEISEPKNGSLHRRQVPKEKRRHYTAPHHLSAKTLNEMPKDGYNQDKLGRSLDDADMERALRSGPAPDVVRSALPQTKLADNTIDQLLAAPQKILIPERYIPEKPPELSPEEQQKRQEKVESIKKMLTSSSADPNKSPDADEKRQREHLLQMNQILAKQVTEMSKIIAVKALEELPKGKSEDSDDRSPDVELPIYQQRDNFFT